MATSTSGPSDTSGSLGPADGRGAAGSAGTAASTAAKTERLLNLVIALLNSRRFRPASWIRANVAGYADAPSDEAFGRMFERDKNELRVLQVPLETDGADGYRIPPTEFSLPPLSFTPEETAAVGLAARLWTTTSLAGAGQQALRKIREAGADTAKTVGTAGVSGALRHGSGHRTPDAPDAAAATAAAGTAATDATGGGGAGLAGREERSVDGGPMIPPESVLQPRVRTADPAFPPLQAAVLARRQVRFDYAKEPGDTPQRRSLQPWGLVSFRGRWYVIGKDLDRGAQRTFRLSRIVGPVSGTGKSGAYEVPSDVDLLEQVRRQATPVVRRWATIRARPGRAVGLRRDAELISAGGPAGTSSGADSARADPAGSEAGADPAGADPAVVTAAAAWDAADVLRIPMPWLWDTARRIAAAGPDVLVVEPDDLRDAVLHLLRGAARHDAAGAENPPGTGASPGSPAAAAAGGAADAGSDRADSTESGR